MNNESSQPGTVIVIDDDEAVGMFSTAVLEQALDMEVLRFSKPELALSYLRTQVDSEGNSNVDAILCDFQMPNLSGHDFLVELRSLGLDVPVTFLSGYVDKETLMQALRLGAFDVIAKPPSKNVISKTMEVAIKVGAKKKENRSQLKLLSELSNSGVHTAETASAMARAIDIIQVNQRSIFLLSLRNYANRVA